MFSGYSHHSLARVRVFVQCWGSNEKSSSEGFFIWGGEMYIYPHLRVPARGRGGEGRGWGFLVYISHSHSYRYRFYIQPISNFLTPSSVSRFVYPPSSPQLFETETWCEKDPLGGGRGEGRGGERGRPWGVGGLGGGNVTIRTPSKR